MSRTSNTGSLHLSLESLSRSETTEVFVGRKAHPSEQDQQFESFWLGAETLCSRLGGVRGLAPTPYLSLNKTRHKQMSTASLFFS